MYIVLIFMKIARCIYEAEQLYKRDLTSRYTFIGFTDCCVAKYPEISEMANTRTNFGLR